MDVDDEPELVDGFRLNEEEFGASGRSRPE
jgi:hypothetical protein